MTPDEFNALKARYDEADAHWTTLCVEGIRRRASMSPSDAEIDKERNAPALSAAWTELANLRWQLKAGMDHGAEPTAVDVRPESETKTLWNELRPTWPNALFWMAIGGIVSPAAVHVGRYLARIAGFP